MNAQLSFADFAPSAAAALPVAAAENLGFGPDLSPQQKLVRDAAGGNQVVVAGAGTGKTEALVQRILKLLIAGDGGEDAGENVAENGGGPAELSQVVALTFTDKGAAEMRGRVYERMVRVLRKSPRGDLRLRLETLRADFAVANRISTFDAFSYRVLAQFPGHSPLPGEVEILDDATRAEMEGELARRFWNRVEISFTEAQKMELWELLDVFSSRRAALETISQLADQESEQNLRDLALLPLGAEWAAGFRDEIGRERAALWAHVTEAVEALELPAAMRAELLDEGRILLAGKGGILTQKDWAAPFVKRWSPELLPGMSRVQKRLFEWRDAATERDEDLEWRSRRLVAWLCGHALWWRGEAQEWCAARGVASFSAIADAALQMVQIPAVAASLRAEISHLLIDEFQDTNWRQWALLDALRDQKIGNVLIVGDEKQAIFRFRGGDITVFDGVRKILLGKKNADELTVSRRSTTQLVKWTNRVFRRVLPSPETRQPFEAPFQDLQAASDFEPSARDFKGSDFKSSDSEVNGLWQLQPSQWHSARENALSGDQKLLVAARDERASRALARFLRALCDDAALWKTFDQLGQNNGAAPNLGLPDLQFPDLREISRKISRRETAIGVIFTKHAFKTRCESELRALGVPFVSVAGKGFWLSDDVALALHLLQFLLDANDRAAFVGLARSALGGLSDVALLEWHLALRERDENENQSGNQNESDGENAAPLDAAATSVDGCAVIAGFSPSLAADALAWTLLSRRLEAWRELARVAPFSEVLDAVLRDSELAFYAAGEGGGAQGEANWHKIIDITRAREAGGQGDLRELNEAFSALIEAAQSNDVEAQAPLPGEAAIQLMTVWAAKGLGFPMTILAQLDTNPGFKRELLMRGERAEKRQMALRLSDEDEKKAAPWLWEKLGDAAKAEEEAQHKRLFYVACTRAESQLVLLWPEQPVGNAVAWMNLCEDARDELREIRPPLALDARAFEVARDLEGTVAAPPVAIAAPLPRATPREIALSEIAGAPAERFGARARTWLEGRLETLGGAPEAARQDVPFSTPAPVLGIENREWLVGAWEWLAPLPDDSVLLLASGANSEIAAARADLMRLAAQDAGFEVRECWALWASGEETEGKLAE